MIGKAIVGKSFAGFIRYVVNRQEAKIIAGEGVRMHHADSMIQDFNLQRMMRPELGKAVGHIVLSWSKEDTAKLTDEIMTERAKEYLGKVGILDTQFVMVRHHDREHPHLHLIYNRVNNKGQTISDQNNYKRNIRACKEITLAYGYQMGKGKEQVNRQALKGKEMIRYELFDGIRKATRLSNDWDTLKSNLEKRGIEIEFKYKSGTTEIQGVSFHKGSIKFKGSAIDRSLSYGNLERQLNANQNLKITQRLSNNESNQSSNDLPAQNQTQNINKTMNHRTSTHGDKLLNLLLKPDEATTGNAQPDHELTDAAKRRKKKRQAHHL